MPTDTVVGTKDEEDDQGLIPLEVMLPQKGQTLYQDSQIIRPK